MIFRRKTGTESSLKCLGLCPNPVFAGRQPVISDRKTGYWFVPDVNRRVAVPVKSVYHWTGNWECSATVFSRLRTLPAAVYSLFVWFLWFLWLLEGTAATLTLDGNTGIYETTFGALLFFCNACRTKTHIISSILSLYILTGINDSASPFNPF